MNKILIFLSSLLFLSCTTGGVVQKSDIDNSEVVVNFLSSQTKANDNSFEVGDQVGIYALNSGKKLNEVDGIYGGYANFKYKATSPVVLSPVDDRYKMFFPVDLTKKLDFIAYFPYKESVNVSDNKLAVDIFKQDISANNDLYAMYSDNAKSTDKSYTEIGLKFRYAMSKVVIKLLKGVAVEQGDLTGLKLRVLNANTTALIDLKDLTFSNYGGKTNNNDKVMEFVANEKHEIELFFLPYNGVTGIEFVFTDKYGNNLYYNIPDGHTFEPSKRYNYNLTMNKQIVQPNVEIAEWENGGDRNGEASQQ